MASVNWSQSLEPDSTKAISESRTHMTFRQTDAVWVRRIWQIIDLKHPMNQFFYQSPRQQVESKTFITILMQAILQNKIAVYDPLYDDFRMRMSLNEVKQSWSETYKRTYERPYPPYEQFDSITTKSFDSRTIKKFKLKEEWFYNKQTGEMETKIIGLCPVKENIDISGEFKGYSDMFWIYFPELEALLANEMFFKPFVINNRQIETYKDIFTHRYFSSFIYKEDNTYNRQISDYTKQSIDALLEAEKSKENIRVTESDFWEE